MKRIYEKRIFAALLTLIMVMGVVIIPATDTWAAGKKTVYVITKMKSLDNDGQLCRQNNLSYNKNGLLTKNVDVGYKKNVYTISYDKKMRPKAFVMKWGQSNNSPDWIHKWEFSSYTKKGNPISGYEISDTQDSDYAGLDYKKEITLEYDDRDNLYRIADSGLFGLKRTYKKDNLVRMDSSEGKYATLLTYDKKNNLKTFSEYEIEGSDWTQVYSFNISNKYNKKGRLSSTKSKYSYNGKASSYGDRKNKYTYKKMTVPSKYVSRIKKQQKELLLEMNNKGFMMYEGCYFVY